MSYESDCDDYAVFGDPERDHYDYEEAARYDRFDGFRDDVDFDFDPGCPDCNIIGSDCEACAAAAEYLEEQRLLDSEETAARIARENDPNSDDYVPF